MSVFNTMQHARNHDNSIKWAYCTEEGLVVSKMMVCKSAAGYYPGRLCYDHDCGFVEPYSRNEMYGYFPTREGAQEAIDDMVF